MALMRYAIPGGRKGRTIGYVPSLTCEECRKKTEKKLKEAEEKGRK